MALARRGARTIVVGGKPFRWKGSSTITVESVHSPGGRLRVAFDFYHVQPKQVADAIAHALSAGWDPSHSGDLFTIQNGNAVLPEYPLWHAANSGDVVALNALLAAGWDCNTRLQGLSVLGSAVWSRQVGSVEALLKAGADPNGGSDEWPPLTIAVNVHVVGCCALDLVRLLLRFGVDVHKPGKYGRTALFDARCNSIRSLIGRPEYPYVPALIAQLDQIVDLLESAEAAL